LASRGGKILVFALLAFAVLIVLAGCGTSGSASEETSGKPAVIYFWEPGWGACKAMEPIMAQVENEYGDRVDFISYNGLEERDKAGKYGIRAYPTFLFVDGNGEIVDKVVGQRNLASMRDYIERLLPPSNSWHL
jgi:thioredoxin